MKFNFSIDPDGELDGNDASQEHFTGHRLTSVAREIGQNTNDARSDDACTASVPAVVSFEKIYLSPDEIPDISGLREKLRGCINYAKEHLGNQEYVRFYQEALTALSKARIPTLRVSDWNTTGLEGPFSGASPAIAFAKGKGISKKASATSGGSRGIGKNAIFTISDLRTSFFSTYYRDKTSGELAFLSQGKSVLISDLDNSSIRRGTGYCGGPKAMAIESEEDVPHWLQRIHHKPKGQILDLRGLSLFALGFNQGADWHFKLAASALITFFSAIQRRRLEFHITDSKNTQIIDHKSYLDFFEDAQIVQSLDADEKRQFDKAKIYATLLEEAEAESASVRVEYFESQNLGKFRLCIKVQDDLPKTVALIRTGMLITESMPLLSKFSGKDFVAVLEAQTDKGVSFLRSLEGAEHNALEPDRIENSDERKKARKLLRDVTKRAREIIDRYISIEIDKADEIEELAQFFPYEIDPSEDDREKSELNPLGRLILVPKQRRIGKPHFRAPENDDDVTPVDYKPIINHGDSRENPAGGPDGSRLRGDTESALSVGGKKELVDIYNVRAPIGGGTSSRRRISFTAADEGDLEIALFISGADEDYPLFVKESSVGVVNSGRVLVSGVAQGQRLTIDAVLSEEFTGAIKIVAYKITLSEGVSDEI